MKVKFSHKIKPEFYTQLKTRIDNYFKENNISPTGNGLMFTKSIFFLGIFFATYGLILSGIFSGATLVLLTINLGLFTAFIGFNVAHDAVHGSYSNNPTLNKIMSYSFDMLGASSYMWNIMHNQVHHTFTNIPEHDDDLNPIFLIRLHPEKKLYKIHKFQHWYATFFYGLTSMSWVFMKDFVKIFQKEIGSFSYRKHPLKEIVIMFVSKALYYFTFIILPMLVLELAWWQVLIGFLIMHIAQGITLAIVFQLAHVVENTTFPTPAPDGSIENNWAIHQLNTTANFAMKSKLATWFFGGLNYQIEHHLFPRICHVHYPKISEIVEETALEYNIPYIKNKTMWNAVRSHYRLLKKLGREETLQAA